MYDAASNEQVLKVLRASEAIANDTIPHVQEVMGPERYGQAVALTEGDLASFAGYLADRLMWASLNQPSDDICAATLLSTVTAILDRIKRTPEVFEGANRLAQQQLSTECQRRSAPWN